MNIVAQVMGTLVSLLCGVGASVAEPRRASLFDVAGCMFVHTVALCVMDKIFPPICVFPYNVYSKIFTGSGVVARDFCALDAVACVLSVQCKCGRA